MKKFTILVLTALLLFTSLCASVNAASAQTVTGMNAVIVSTRASVRVEMDTNSKRIVSLTNGEQMFVTGEKNDWYIIDRASIGQGEGEAFILKRYVKLYPNYITLPKEVTLWADPWRTGIANGSKSKGTILLVLSESSEWLCVQTNDLQAGASFISKAELYGMENSFTNQDVIDLYNRPKAVVACNTLAVRRNQNDAEEPIGYLHNGDIVEIVTRGAYFTGVVWEIAGYKTECWVHTKHLQELIQ